MSQLGLPYSATAGSSFLVHCKTDWVTGKPLTVNIAVSPIGYSTPSAVVLGVSATEPVSITLPALPLGFTSYTVSLSFAGDLANNYVVSDPAIIRVTNFTIVSSSANFTLLTDTPSIQAMWAAGAMAGTGVATFNSVAGATPWLLLNQGSDTGGQAIQSKFGIAEITKPTGFSFSLCQTQQQAHTFNRRE